MPDSAAGRTCSSPTGHRSGTPLWPNSMSVVPNSLVPPAAFQAPHHDMPPPPIPRLLMSTTPTATTALKSDRVAWTSQDEKLFISFMTEHKAEARDGCFNPTTWEADARLLSKSRTGWEAQGAVLHAEKRREGGGGSRHNRDDNWREAKLPRVGSLRRVVV